MPGRFIKRMSLDIDQKQCRKRKQNIAKKGHTNCSHVEIKRIDVLDASSRVRMRPFMENKGSSEALPRGCCALLEPVCCKKQQKKFLTGCWFVENGTSEDYE